MAHFTKDVYNGKREYAAKIMDENAKINTLTEPQHTALAELCRIRHVIHQDPCSADNLYCAESADYEQYWSYIGTQCSNNKIKELLNDANLPAWSWNCDETAYPIDYTADDEGVEYEGAIPMLAELIEAWNTSIEEYLRQIDETHGTHYEPTGMSRIF